MILIAKPHARGKKHIFPVLGTVEVPENGEIEIEDEELARAIAQGGNFTVQGEEAKVSEAVKVAEDALMNQSGEDALDIEETLNKLDLKGLCELASEGGDKFKGWNLFKKKEEVLRKFILNKLTIKTDKKAE